MSDDKKYDLERPYVVDGIKEYDNPLPPWFIVLFVGTIIFGVLYFTYYEIFTSESIRQELAADEAEYKQLQAKLDQKAGTGDLDSELKNPEMIAAGKETYSLNCAPCHGAQGQGVVGPNLTDKYWLHGGSSEDIMKSINNGFPDKGMVAWKTILGRTKIKQLTAFVLSIGDTNPPNPKAPQGELYERQ